MNNILGAKTDDSADLRTDEEATRWVRSCKQLAWFIGGKG